MPQPPSVSPAPASPREPASPSPAPVPLSPAVAARVQAALDEAKATAASALSARGFAPDLATSLVESMEGEIREGLAPGQVQEQEAALVALANWDGQGEVPDVAQDFVDQLGEVAQAMISYYQAIGHDPAGYLAAKARMFLTFLDLVRDIDIDPAS